MNKLKKNTIEFRTWLKEIPAMIGLTQLQKNANTIARYSIILGAILNLSYYTYEYFVQKQEVTHLIQDIRQLKQVSGTNYSAEAYRAQVEKIHQTDYSDEAFIALGTTAEDFDAQITVLKLIVQSDYPTELIMQAGIIAEDLADKSLSEDQQILSGLLVGFSTDELEAVGFSISEINS